MTQGGELDGLIRARIKALRVAQGLSLGALAERCFLSASSLSRIETGQRRIAIDQLVPIARALGTSVDQLIEPVADDDVVIRPRTDRGRGVTTWLLSRADGPQGVEVVKMRISSKRPPPQQVHPGSEWLTVLSGRLRLHLGDRVITVGTGEAAQFSTMLPHALSAEQGPVEIIGIFDATGRRAHRIRPDDTRS